jgi:epoxide hydrolase 4
VAWSLAALRPDLLKQLLIVNSPHPGTFLRDLKYDPAQQAASAYMNWLCQPEAERLLAEDDYRRLFASFLQGSAWLTPAVKELYRAAWANQGRGLTGPLNYYRASPLRPPLASTDAIHTLQLPDALLTVKVPTTVLWGELDIALRPSLLDGLDRWVPRLSVQRVPDASHWIVHEQPGRVADTIARLLA